MPTAQPTLPASLRRWALLWLLLVLGVLLHNLSIWWWHPVAMNSDVLAMLPQNEQDPAVQAATRHLADAGQRRIVVLVGGADWASSRAAGDALAASLSKGGSGLSVRFAVSDNQAGDWLGFFTPYRQGLLTPAQRELLQKQGTVQLANQAVQSLYQPLGLAGMPRVVSWPQDPLNLMGTWLAARASESRVRVQDGRLSLSVPPGPGESSTRHFAVLMLETPGSGFAAKPTWAPALEAARQQTLAQHPGAQIVMAGVPLHAAAAAAQAEKEIHTIGLGSLVGIVLLTLAAFSALRPRVLVTLSIAVGLLTAVSVTVLCFGGMHWITLVFGASLVGVAENYGTNYFSSLLSRPAHERWPVLRAQAPVMGLAMLTTAIGYALLALTPFPGLRQIAVFSAVGLLAAFTTVILWFPFLDRGVLGGTRFAQWLGSAVQHWPAWGRSRWLPWAAGLLAVMVLLGLSRLKVNDDIRALQSSPPELMQQQIDIGRRLDMPSPAQFYLVRGESPEAVLRAEEALKPLLDQAQRQGHLGGYQAVSDWVPSPERQASDSALVQRVVHGPGGVLQRAGEQLGQPLAAAPSAPSPVLRLSDWLAASVSEPLRHQWLGELPGADPSQRFASVILLRGVQGADHLAHLRGLANAVPGVRWVDKVGEISELMARTRRLMMAVIAASYALVWAALATRFGRRSWRALAPTALASAVAVAALGWLGQPLQLFNVLALLILLGLGVDYGIFMLEQPDRRAVRPFLSITLAASSTLLAFGLLALSATAALHAFGLTLLWGVAGAWLLTPLFMPSGSNPAQPGPSATR